jgi:multicomponent Na+:H+ antiporter subunit B
MKKIIIWILFIALFLILSIGIFDMPTSPTLDAPSYNETIHYYLENGVNETGAINIVTAVITDYRGFDTLGETIVLFAAIVAVSSVLRIPSKKNEEEAQKHE